MTKLMHKAALAAIALAAGAAVADAAVPSRLKQHEGFPFMPKVEAPAGMFTSALKSTAPAGMHKVAPPQILAGADETGFLQAPDGTRWFYTGNYTYEEIKHEYYTERILRAFEYDIYDQDFTLVGTIRDTPALAEGQSRFAQFELCTQVTQKFVNSDSKYEVAVAFQINSGSDYFLEASTKFYSIGGAKTDEGNDVAVLTVPGYPVDYLNAAPDRWSENFFFTFLEELVPAEDFNPDTENFDEAYDAYIMAFTQKLSIYKWGGWGAPAKIQELNVPRACLPGDGSNAPFMMSKLNSDGKPVFLLQQYEKSLFINKIDLGGSDDDSDEDDKYAGYDKQTPDNKLNIDIYTLDNLYASKLTKSGSTTIQCTTSEGGYRFYAVGGLRGTDDFDFKAYGASGDMPGYLVTVDDYTFGGSDEYISSYYIHNPAGELVKPVFEYSENYINLPASSGFEAQTLFIQLSSGGYTFTAVDLPSGNQALVLPQVVDGEAITANIARYVADGDYQYVTVLAQDELDNDLNVNKRVAWIDRSGSIVGVDRINVGRNVPVVQVALDESILSPYYFNTDDKREYMVILQRYVNAAGGESETKEEFHVISTDGHILLSGDPSIGTLISVMPLEGSPNRLDLVYNTGNGFTQQIFELPLEKFAGGEGTAEKPYLIATPGDLNLIVDKPAAHYALTANIDASALNFNSVANFTGSLDGRGHIISGLHITAAGDNAGMFASTGDGARIVNLNLTNPVVDATGTQTAGVLIGAAGLNNTISEVNIYGAQVSGENATTFGTIAGRAVGSTAISLSSVVNAEINLPGALAAGIVGETRTGASIDACAFNGVIEAASAAGIVGELHTDSHVKNCHVAAELYGELSVGGIVASSARGKVFNNYVEGMVSLESDATEGLSLGGVVAVLSPDWEQNATDAIVSHNVVAADLLVGAPEGADVKAHRIVGRSIVDQIDPEGEITFDAEKCLADNYAVADAIDETIGAENAASTEGLTIAADDLTADKFSELGFAFGNSVESPWAAAGTEVALYIERAYLLLTPEIQVVAGEVFTVDLHMIKNPEITVEEFIEDFLCEFDAEHLEMTGNADIADGVLSIEFMAKKIASSTISLTHGGTQCSVAVTSISGISDITVDGGAAAPSISFDGATVAAAGCRIELFSLQGVAVAAATDSLSTENLAAGLYIALARDAEGRSATRKIAVK